MNQTILLRGREHQLVVVADGNPRAAVRIEGDRILVYVGQGSQAAVRRALNRWFRSQADISIKQAVWRASRALGLQPGKIAIRNQRTRWGSCSNEGNLSFNMKLIAAPPEVLEYVVVHELMHLKERNHSDRFWELVRSQCRDYVQAREWLRRNALRIDI
jgi:hypothetical protein